MSVEEYLKNKFGTVTTLKNGNYKVVTSDGTEIYVPRNFNTSTKLCGIVADSEESINDTRLLMEGDNAPSNITIISPNGKMSTNILTLGTQIIKDNNSSVGGVVMTSAGTGVETGINCLNAYLKDNPDLADAAALVLKDGNLGNYNNASILKEKNVPIVYVSDSASNMQENVSRLTKDGFNAIGDTVNSTVNEKVDEGTVVKDYAQYLLGDSEKLESDSKVTHKNYKYDKESNKFVAAEGIAALVIKAKTTPTPENPSTPEPTPTPTPTPTPAPSPSSSGGSHKSGGGGGGNGSSKDKKPLDINDIKNLTKSKPFEIKEENSAVAQKYQGLKDTPSLGALKHSSDVVTTDYDYAVSSMNEIRSQISKSSFLSGLKKQSFRSASGIPGIIPTNIDKYFSIVGAMLTNLKGETDAVGSIAQAYVDQDEYLKKGIEGTISDTQSPTVETPSTVDTSGDTRVYNSDPVINEKILKLLNDPYFPNTDHTELEPTNENFKKLRGKRKIIACIDADTGEVYREGDLVHLKKGEAKRLIVKTPTNNGNVLELGRVTADNCGNGDKVHTYSDIDPDPNHVDYVNICNKEGKYSPKNKELVKTDHYDWVIEAGEKDTNGKEFSMSQTVQYKTDVSKNEYWKAMLDLRFVIED